jgi:ZIP family zinc transporter
VELLTNRVILATLAAAMVFLGLPLARLRSPRPSFTAFLYALSTGILLFLFLDLIGHARELPWEILTTAAAEYSTELALFVTAVFIGGLGVGFVMLAALKNRWDGASTSIRPEAGADLDSSWLRNEKALSIGTLIALGIGLYNFAQGLAIGEAGRFTVPTAVGSGQGEFLLLVGLALHNAIKGVAIAAPLAGRQTPWNYLLFLGVVAGGPTVAGAVVGASLWAPIIFVAVLTIGAGATLFTIYETLSLERRLGSRKQVVGGLFAGFAVATITTIALEISHYSLPELMSSYRL